MAKKQVVKQRYFVAAQSTKDGKTVLTLLSEGKDSTSCQAIMRSQEFADSHLGDPSPVRVCILRDEPAIRIKMKPNALALEIAEALAGGPPADKVLAILAKHRVPVSGEIEAEEVPDELPEPLSPEEQEGAQEEIEEAVAPEALPQPETPPSEDTSLVNEPMEEATPMNDQADAALSQGMLLQTGPSTHAQAVPPPPGYESVQPPASPPSAIPTPKLTPPVPPPPPVSPPPAVAPGPMVKGENKSGQAPPAFGSGFGVPPLPPPPSGQ